MIVVVVVATAIITTAWARHWYFLVVHVRVQLEARLGKPHDDPTRRLVWSRRFDIVNCRVDHNATVIPIAGDPSKTCIGTICLDLVVVA